MFADDIVPRHVTTALHLDYDTVAGADRFGNVFVSRLPPEISALVGGGGVLRGGVEMVWVGLGGGRMGLRVGIVVCSCAFLSCASLPWHSPVRLVM